MKTLVNDSDPDSPCSVCIVLYCIVLYCIVSCPPSMLYLLRELFKPHADERVFEENKV